MQTEIVWTSDGLKLPGFHFSGSDTCVLTIHGMSGNFLENFYAHEIGKVLAKQNIGYIYGHNRGYGHINDITTKHSDGSTDYTRVGSTYEIFNDSDKDVAVWVDKCRELGYKNIVLMGHSLGCNKVIYYLHKNPDSGIKAVILSSPPDMVGLMKLDSYQPYYKELLVEATQLMQEAKPREILTHDVWDWYRLSAQTFLSLSEEGGPVDNLPVLRSPERFDQLETITQPILGIMGEFDDIGVVDLRKDIELIKSKALACKSFDIQFIEGADHGYNGKENELASTILEWVNKLA